MFRLALKDNTAIRTILQVKAAKTGASQQNYRLRGNRIDTVVPIPGTLLMSIFP